WWVTVIAFMSRVAPPVVAFGVALGRIVQFALQDISRLTYLGRSSAPRCGAPAHAHVSGSFAGTPATSSGPPGSASPACRNRRRPGSAMPITTTARRTPRVSDDLAGEADGQGRHHLRYADDADRERRARGRSGQAAGFPTAGPLAAIAGLPLTGER